MTAVLLRSHEDDDAHAEKTSQKYSMQIGIFINFVCQKKNIYKHGPQKKFTCELLQRCRIGNTKKNTKIVRPNYQPVPFESAIPLLADEIHRLYAIT